MNVACKRSSWAAPRSGVLSHNRPWDAGAVDASGQPQRGRGAASAQLRHRSALFLQPPHVGMADEPARARPGEHDGMDAWITVDAVHQRVEFVGDVDAEQAVRAAVDSHDQDGPAVLDLEVAVALAVS